MSNTETVLIFKRFKNSYGRISGYTLNLLISLNVRNF